MLSQLEAEHTSDELSTKQITEHFCSQNAAVSGVQKIPGKLEISNQRLYQKLKKIVMANHAKCSMEFSKRQTSDSNVCQTDNQLKPKEITMKITYSDISVNFKNCPWANNRAY